MPDPDLPPWPGSLAVIVGRRVAHFRRERKLTAQQLSDELRDRLGVDMKRTVLGGLESGARKAVSLWELYALAYVLGVPPILLMTPLGAEELTEVLPGRDVDPWEVARWVSGEGPPPHAEWELHDEEDPDYEEPVVARLWNRHVDLLNLYREHEQKVAEWRDQPKSALGDSVAEAKRSLEVSDARRREIESALKLIRRAIRGRGDLPPWLPVELAHLDDDVPHPRVREQSSNEKEGDADGG